ncbi:unnamed protein product [Pedinophyceae sp. YPF-701]|nr:unnamed protein product [Pedinophyceae sp. YPF-701]
MEASLPEGVPLDDIRLVPDQDVPLPHDVNIGLVLEMGGWPDRDSSTFARKVEPLMRGYAKVFREFRLTGDFMTELDPAWKPYAHQCRYLFQTYYCAAGAMRSMLASSKDLDGFILLQADGYVNPRRIINLPRDAIWLQKRPDLGPGAACRHVARPPSNGPDAGFTEYMWYTMRIDTLNSELTQIEAIERFWSKQLDKGYLKPDANGHFPLNRTHVIWDDIKYVPAAAAQEFMELADDAHELGLFHEIGTPAILHTLMQHRGTECYEMDSAGTPGDAVYWQDMRPSDAGHKLFCEFPFHIHMAAYILYDLPYEGPQDLNEAYPKEWDANRPVERDPDRD